jgi:hypothetical protein
MHQRDVAALNKALGAFRGLSPRARAEISELQLRCGWRATAIHASMRCQRIALGLPDTSLTPSELKAEKVGGLGPEIWLADPAGIDEFRWLSASTLRSLLRLGLSRYEPSPAHAVEQEQARRKALGVATAPSDGAV